MKNKKIVSLICALAMIFSMFSAMTVSAADKKGINLASTISTDNKTITLDATAVGTEELLNSFLISVNLPEGVTNDNVTATTTADTKLSVNVAGSVLNVAFLDTTGDGIAFKDGKLATITINLTNALTDDFVFTLTSEASIEDANGEVTVAKGMDATSTTVVPSGKPTPKPSEPSISVKASSTTVEFDKKFTVTATVKNAKDGAKVAFTTNDDEKYAVIFGTPTEINSKGETKATYVANDKAGTVTITATYKDTEGNEKSASVKVTVKKASTTTGGNDGTTSGGGPSIIAPGHTGAVTTPNTNTNYKPDFQDLDSVEWARTAINGLAMRGMINGRDQYTFDPNANITRAEYCQILMGAINALNAKGESTFSDVPSTAWYYNAVSVASQLGIVSGYGDGNFGPNDLITRQDMALMTYKTAKIMNKSLEPVNAEITFEDSHEISDYAFEAVMTLQKAGIINGMTDTTFEPHSNATRAQSAKVIFDTFVDAQ